VNLRNLMIQGFDSGLSGINVIGAGQGSNVYVEDTLITGEFGGSGNGIVDNRGRGMLVVNNTTIRNLGGAGILVSSSNNGSRRAMISNTRIYNGNNGIVAGTNSEIEVSHSVVSGMTSAGVQVTNAASIVDLDSVTIAHSGTGIQNSGTVRISNSDIAFNTTGVTGGAISYSNNRFKSNGTDGTVTAIGSTTNPTGQH
jgi:parallel beta helix pectate lyase-like protein